MKPDHSSSPGSVEIAVGEAIVVGQSVSFPVQATADQIAILDPAALKAMVLGKPIAEAKAILAPYGQVEDQRLARLDRLGAELREPGRP